MNAHTSTSARPAAPARRRTAATRDAIAASIAAIDGERVTVGKDDDTITSAVVNVAATHRASVAARAADDIRGVLAASDEDARKRITDEYGADVTRGALTIARRVALTIAGDPAALKYRGETRASVLRALALLQEHTPDADPTARVLIAAAQASADARKSEKNQRAARKTALADTLNDPDASLEQRAAALDTLAGMEEQDRQERRAAFRAELDRAMVRALAVLGAEDVESAAAAHIAAYRGAMERGEKWNAPGIK